MKIDQENIYFLLKESYIIKHYKITILDFENSPRSDN